VWEVRRGRCGACLAGARGWGSCVAGRGAWLRVLWLAGAAWLEGRGWPGALSEVWRCQMALARKATLVT
jgi:hypothetical protein